MHKLAMMIVLLALPLLGMAQEDTEDEVEPEFAGPMFEDLDTDFDGYISREESTAIPELHENYDKSDLNDDGQLDVSEFAAFEGADQPIPPYYSSEPEPGAAPYSPKREPELD